ncbi:alpha-1B-glycoprotein-like [Pelodiscus sinensis]|uniref:alpha-1B-glycoprotein-like n=1 Tax=Pelodiscus sinensis TaxID=13735 RepID=UPI003F6B643B
MELTRLLPLLDPLPAPSLSLDRSSQIYLPGEQVTLTCSAPANQWVTGYRFFLLNELQEPSTIPHPNGGAQLALIAQKGRAGAYTCAYWRQESSGEISSGNSNSISITVRDPPAAPTFALSPPHQLYLSGESVQLTCSPPSGNEAVTRFQFSKEEKRIFLPFVPPGNSYSGVRNLKLKPGDSGSYTCRYWIHPPGREIQSLESPPVLITLTARPLVPKLTVSPPHGSLLHGESVNLTCSVLRASTQSGIRFFKGGQIIDSRKLHESWSHVSTFLLLLNVSESEAGAYSCDYWKIESGREIPSKRTQPISITVIDTLPQPSLSMDPPSGVVTDGFSLLLTCTAPWDDGERRFHFYKDNVKFVPGEAASEINTTGPSTSSVKVSVLHIPWASLNNTGEFTCGYEENVSGKWIPSPRSQAVTIPGNITVSAPSFLWARELAVGGSFFIINGLIIFLSHCCL